MKSRFVWAGMLSLLLMGCDGDTTYNTTQYNLGKVQPEMTQADVRFILGPPTEYKEEPIPNDGGTQTTYTYRKGSHEVVIVFKNDKVQTKSGSF